MKNHEIKNPNQVLEKIKELENAVGFPAFDEANREDIQVSIRVNETIGPAKFKPDPLIPGGFIANSLTIRAMRPDIFVMGDSLDDLSAPYECKCGSEFDMQFWKLCPYCGLDIHA